MVRTVLASPGMENNYMVLLWERLRLIWWNLSSEAAFLVGMRSQALVSNKQEGLNRASSPRPREIEGGRALRIYVVCLTNPACVRPVTIAI